VKKVLKKLKQFNSELRNIFIYLLMTGLKIQECIYSVNIWRI